MLHYYYRPINIARQQLTRDKNGVNSEHVSGAWAAKFPLTAHNSFCNSRSPLRSATSCGRCTVFFTPGCRLPLTRFSARFAAFPRTLSDNDDAVACFLKFSAYFLHFVWILHLNLSSAPESFSKFFLIAGPPFSYKWRLLSSLLSRTCAPTVRI